MYAQILHATAVPLPYPASTADVSYLVGLAKEVYPALAIMDSNVYGLLAAVSLFVSTLSPDFIIHYSERSWPWFVVWARDFSIHSILQSIAHLAPMRHGKSLQVTVSACASVPTHFADAPRQCPASYTSLKAYPDDQR